VLVVNNVNNGQPFPNQNQQQQQQQGQRQPMFVFNGPVPQAVAVALGQQQAPPFNPQQLAQIQIQQHQLFQHQQHLLQQQRQQQAQIQPQQAPPLNPQALAQIQQVRQREILQHPQQAQPGLQPLPLQPQHHAFFQQQQQQLMLQQMRLQQAQQQMPKVVYPKYNPKNKVNHPIPQVDAQTLYTCGKELLQYCKEKKFPLKIKGLEDLGPSLIYIVDEQDRNPIHIILSHGTLGKKDENAIKKLVQLCPELLRMPDSNGKTPLDLLYEMDSVGMDKVFKILDGAYAFGNKNNHFAKLSTLCYAAHAEEFVQYFPSTLSIPSQEELDQISEENNPGRVCYSLGKSQLIEKYISSKFIGGSDFDKLLMFGDPVSIQNHISSRNYSADSLKHSLNLLIEIGCNKDLIKKVIKSLPGSGSTIGYLSNTVIYTYSAYTVNGTVLFLDNPDLFDIYRKCIAHPDFNWESDLALKMIDRLITDKKFVYNDLCGEYDIASNGVINRIFNKNPELARKIIKEYLRLGIQSVLFNDICFYCATKNNFDSLDALLPILKEEGIPIQLNSNSGCYVLGALMNSKQRVPFFEKIEALVPRETIVQSLYLIWNYNFIEQFLQSLSDDPNEPLFFKKLMGYVEDIENLLKTKSARRNFVLMALSSGDSELEAKVPSENLDSWLMKGSDFHKNAPFITMPTIEGIKRFLKNELLLSQKTREILLPSNQTFPFSHQLMIKEILENDDQELLEGFSAISNHFDPILVIEHILASPKKVDLEVLKKLLPPAPWDLTKSKGSLSDNFVNLDLDVFELLIDEYIIDRIPDINLEDVYARYEEERLNCTYRECTIKAIANQVEITYPADSNILHGRFSLNFLKKDIDRYYEIQECKNIEFLKENQLKDHARLVFSSLSKNEMENNYTVVIMVRTEEFAVLYRDFESGTLKAETYAQTPEKLIKLKAFVDERLALFEERKQLLNNKYPEIIVHISGKETILNSLVLSGVPTVATVERKLNQQTGIAVASNAGFTYVKTPSDVGSFSNLVDNNILVPAFTEISTINDSLNLLIMKSQFELFMIHAGQRSDWDTYIPEMWRIFSAINGVTVNYETAKNFEFSNVRTIIHETVADIDLDCLNQVLRTSKNSPFLNSFITKKNMPYEQLSSNLEALVATIKKGHQIKKLSLEDSNKIAIMLTHTVQRLREPGNEDNLRLFVCELAFDSAYCAWRITDRVTSGYKTAFNLLKNYESVFEELLTQAIHETFTTMMKFVLDNKERNQTIHVEGYLRSKLEPHMNLPQALFNDDFEDEYKSGINDYPPAKVLKFFEAFYIPLLVQTFMIKPSENHEHLSALLDKLIQLVTEKFSFEKFGAIEEKYQSGMGNCHSELNILNETLNQCLTHPDYLKKQNQVAEYDKIPGTLHALINECEGFNNQITALKQGDPIHTLKKRKFSIAPMTEEMKNIQKGLLQCELDERQKKISDLEQKQKSIEIIMQGPIFQNIDAIQTKIKQIKKMIEQYENRMAFEKRECVLEYCRQKQWLTEDEYGTDCFTEIGVVKLLELARIICTPDIFMDVI